MKSSLLTRHLKLYTPLLGLMLSTMAPQQGTSRGKKEQERPHDGIHAKMSCLAYANPALLSQRVNAESTGILLNQQTTGLTEEEQLYADDLKGRGWKVAEYREISSAYAGIAFEHAEHRQLVIAHRGTRPTLAGAPADGYTDLKLIQRQLIEHHVHAMAFTLELYDKYASSERNWQRIGLVGHSLGGFLAQVSLYALARFRASEKGLHSYAVTLDNPGAAEFLESLQPSIVGSERVDLTKLDITNYLSGAVNLVNASGRHIGTVYAIHDPNFPPLSNNPSDYLSNSHSKKRLAECFDAETGEVRQDKPGYLFIRMESWPLIEYPPSTMTTTGFGLVAKEVLDNANLYQHASQSISKVVKSVMNAMPNCLKSMVEQASLLHNLAKTTHELGETAINDTAYQTFRHMQEATLLLGEELQKNPAGVELSEPAVIMTEDKAKSQILMQTLAAKWEKATQFNRPTDLALRHFSLRAGSFLKQFHKEVINTGLAHQPAFQKMFPAFANNPAFMRYTVTKNYVTSTGEEDAKLFRALIEETALTWPAEYFVKNYFLTVVATPKTASFSEVKDKLDACQRHHWDVLRTLRALQTQSRLYLFGIAPAQEITEHREREKDLTELRHALQRQRQDLQSLPVSPAEQSTATQLLAQFDYQDKLLQLSQSLNKALLHLKQKQPEKVIEQVEGVLQSINETSPLAQQMKIDTLHVMRIQELYACCYNLMGKARRQQWQNADNEPQTQAVIHAYKAVLTYVPDDYPTLSSLASFYDDLKNYEEAKIYHEKALRFFEELNHPIEKERKAVTYSNYAWNLYHRAAFSQGSNEKLQLLQNAQRRLESSLKLAPNAGTHLYLAKVELALAELEASPEEASALKNSALRHLDTGLVIEPVNTKLLVERAELQVQCGQEDKAQEDAQEALMLLEDKRQLSEHREYYARAERVAEVAQRQRKKFVLS